MNTSPLRVLAVGLLLAGCAHGGDQAALAPADPGLVESEGAEVSATDIEQAPQQSIEKLLMSRFPGVWVARTPEGGLSIRIRGATSINASTEPLYVIDGIPTNPGPNGALLGVQAQDIETIQVLKDVASTSMYGVRGANGVIVIRTKSPRR
ncbi:MAG TPA: TonB-dependent receptor plug domain-containing protein [Longimicrobiales bacterium]